QMVSGYWLGTEEAVIVRRPRVLLLDERGRLHSGTGTCLEYHDCWGAFFAWHGVRVPDKMILVPGQLTREDFLGQQNLEVRRIIQERMGDRFVLELGGYVIESGPRGTLYEVQLRRDPERVPPTIQTAAEAVAWSFQLAAEAYDSAHES